MAGTYAFEQTAGRIVEVCPMILHDLAPVQLLQFGNLAAFPELIHAVSTRRGGVSQGPYESLNISFRVGDTLNNVRTNRNRLCHAMGISHHTLVTARQVHGTAVATLTEEEWQSEPDVDLPAFPGTDAMVTAAIGAILMISLADCTSVTFFDPVQRVVGLAHCGWRGTVGGLARDVVSTMASAFGSNPADIRVGIGPSIGPCCYEVGDDVVQAWSSAEGQRHASATVERGGRRYFDLWIANRLQLQDTGIDPQHIETAEICTSCHQDLLFSHRGSGGHSGRFAALAGLR